MRPRELGIPLRGIYTNIEDAVCRYVKRVDTRAFPASFVVALSWKLASMLAGALIRGTEGAKMVQSCEQMYMLTLDQAKGLDAKQSRKFEEAVPPWIRIRDGSINIEEDLNGRF